MKMPELTPQQATEELMGPFFGAGPAKTARAAALILILETAAVAAERKRCRRLVQRCLMPFHDEALTALWKLHDDIRDGKEP